MSYVEGELADADKHKLDIYLPEGLEEFPTVLWIHGGAWVVGGRKQEEQLARRFAERGIGMVAISYRLSPGIWMDPSLDSGIEHPSHIQDCVQALKWMIEHGEEYGIQTDKLIASGYSAGAHLSALMAADPTYLKEVGLSTDNLLGAVPVAGAYDMIAYYEDHLRESGKEMADGHVLGVFGDLDRVQSGSPTKYIGQTQTPMLVVSETDTHGYTQVYEKMIEAAQVDHIEFYHDRKLTHQTLYKSLSSTENSPTRDIIIAYIQKLSKTRS